jgi:hypothetical protein
MAYYVIGKDGDPIDLGVTTTEVVKARALRASRK